MTATHVWAVALTDLRILGRVRWLQAAVAAGVAIAVLIALAAAGEEGLSQTDALRAEAASLLLLGGLAVAVGLGGGAFAPDASRGYLGLLVGSGATPGALGLGRVAARLVALALVLAVWGLALQAGSLAIGAGVDGPLALHALMTAVNLALVLCATSAMASVIGPVAAGVFGFMVYVSAQATVNLKAGLDVRAISPDSGSFINPLYAVFPRALVSPMINDLQSRDVAGPAAPRLDVNGLEVVVPASTLPTVIWTMAWTAVFAGLAAYGVRRRQL